MTYSKELLLQLEKNRLKSNSSIVESSFSDLTTRRVGLIAQDVQKVLPNIVFHLTSDNQNDTSLVNNTENLLGIAYSDLIPYIITAIQGVDEWTEKQLLQTKVEQPNAIALQAAIDDLESILLRVEEQNKNLLHTASL